MKLVLKMCALAELGASALCGIMLFAGFDVMSVISSWLTMSLILILIVVGYYIIDKDIT